MRSQYCSVVLKMIVILTGQQFYRLDLYLGLAMSSIDDSYFYYH